MAAESAWAANVAPNRATNKASRRRATTRKRRCGVADVCMGEKGMERGGGGDVEMRVAGAGWRMEEAPYQRHSTVA